MGKKKSIIHNKSDFDKFFSLTSVLF